MVIKSYTHLNEKALREFLGLERACRKFDKLKGSVFLDTSLNYNQNIKSIFFLYENRELISMLSMFIPTKREAEISGFTLPKYRSNGYFKALLAQAIEELRNYNVQDILFVCERQSISGQEVMKALQAEYKHSEYTMRFCKSRCEYEAACGGSRHLSLVKSSYEDLEKIVAASMRIFDDNYEDSKGLIEKCFQSKTREQYMAILDDEIIGLVSINQERAEAIIFGLGILPEYRGKGYGKELLQQIVNHLWQTGKTEIMLDVSSENHQALELYKKSGFQVEVVFDYYHEKRLKSGQGSERQ